MNEKIYAVCMLIGVLLLFSPNFNLSLTVVDSADTLDHWSATYGTISLDTTLKFEGAASVAWFTDVNQSRWNCYLTWLTTYGAWQDWTNTPILNVQIYPHAIPSGAEMYLYLITVVDGTDKVWSYGTLSLNLGVWNNVTVDLRNPQGGNTPNLDAVRAVQFHWFLNGYDGEDFKTNVDYLQVLSSGEMQYYTLTVTAGTGGTTNPAPGAYKYLEGTSVTVKGIPDDGYYLNYFILDGVNVGKNDDDTYTVIMDSDHEIQAVFEEQPPEGENETTPLENKATVIINATVGGTTIPKPGTYTYDVGQTVTLMAEPESGYIFNYWLTPEGEVSDATFEYTINAEGQYVFTAVFQPKNQASIQPLPPPPPPTSEFEEQPIPQIPLTTLQIFGVGIMVTSTVLYVKGRRKKS